MKLFTKISLILALLVSGTFMFSNISFADDNNNIKPHKKFYKYNADNKEWTKSKSVKERRQDLQLDEKQLKKLSTEELLVAVLEYPFIGDLFAFDNNDLAIKSVSRHCVALREFMQRKDAKDVLTKAKSNTKKVVKTLNVAKVNTGIIPMVIETLCENNLMGFEKNQKKYVQTPNGTNVYVYSRNEFSAGKINALNNYFKFNYPNAIYMSTSTAKYNCHSYAWYYSSTHNKYWMNYPSAYMNDGSYYQTNNVSLGDVAYYNGEHSALIYSNPNHAERYISKWGPGPLMVHTPYDSPYSNSITKWKR